MDTIHPDLNHQISNNSRFDKIIILGVILFLINMTFVPYKGLNVIKVNSKSEVTDHVKNHVQANTFNHEFNINNPKESKTPILTFLKTTFFVSILIMMLMKIMNIS
ncbi:MAG: hypothetical protein IPL25_03445 [Saprospiraceae bacterium]|nr:hypothetical protein [Candidatus Vicinibacter affinis]